LSALAETANFRRAAELLGISQPSLSAQIDALEHTLGFAVAERNRSGTVLTPPGREVAERARHILDGVVELRDYARDAVRAMKGTLRLGVKASVGPYLMPRVVRDLHRLHPELRLYIREDLGEPLIEELRAGRHDLALVETPLDRPDLRSRCLFEEPLMLVMAADHPLAKKREVDPARLRGARVLGFSGQARFHRDIGRFCKEVDASLVEEYESTSLDALRLMVGSGQGLCFLPALYTASEIRPGDDVVALPLSGAPLRRRIGLAWRKRSEPLSIGRRFAERVAAVIESEFRDVVDPVRDQGSSRN